MAVDYEGHACAICWPNDGRWSHSTAVRWQHWADGVRTSDVRLTSDSFSRPRHDGVHVVIGASSSELARGVIRLLDSAELRERIALQARGFVEENFTWAAAGERVERILKEVCSAGPENYT